MALEKVERGAERAFVLAIPAKDEVQGVADAAAAQVSQQLTVSIGLVKPFVHLGERIGADALQADVDVQQAAALSQVQKRFVTA